MDYAFRRTEGALAVVKAGSEDDVIGIISERDYLTKVALLGKQSRTTPVSAICTQGESNLITVSYDETVDECMRKVRLRVVWYGPGRTVGCTLTPPPCATPTRAGAGVRRPPLARQGQRRQDRLALLRQGPVQVRRRQGQSVRPRRCTVLASCFPHSRVPGVPRRHLFPHASTTRSWNA